MSGWPVLPQGYHVTGLSTQVTFSFSPPPEPKEGFTLSDCRIYWGSHGCCYHDENGSHWCDYCKCEKHPDPDPGNYEDAPSCVAGPPYYGDSTRFYGEDAKENM